MEILIAPDLDRAALLTARIIDRELRANPALVLGLATGRTTERVYHYLAEFHRLEGLDFSAGTTFNLDEYIGIPADHPGSFRQNMETHLFSKVNLQAGNTFLPLGTASDLRAECQRYELLIQERGGLDLQVLGLGNNGHIGFNEPLSALRSRTRDKTLSRATREQNAALFGGDPDQVPARALTMGVGTILEARRCLLLVTGAAKADIVAKVVEGPMTALIPGTALQLHPCCQVVLDEDAAACLQHTADYRFGFAQEPEWAEFRDFAALRPFGRGEGYSARSV